MLNNGFKVYIHGKIIFCQRTDKLPEKTRRKFIYVEVFIEEHYCFVQIRLLLSNSYFYDIIQQPSERVGV